ncbi:MAG TPA: ABC transporter permease [Actinobacteria bacterium]|jgi:ABC-2 type transport system permease protein|nr:ABC transporter permease [Actinomycetota bacterium]
MSDLGLAVRQVRYTNKAFWRNPASVFFTFAFPLMFLVIFTALFGNNTQQIFGRQVSTSTFYVASIAAFSIITATYTNLAISVTFQRDAGILKRTRGTPLPSWAYLFGRIVHAVIVAIILVAIVAAFGAAFYHASLPSRTFAAYVVTIVVGAASFSALGLALTGVIPNADAAPPIVNGIILPLLFLSDIFIPIQNPNAWYVKVAKVFPVYHFSQAMKAAYFQPTGNGFRWSDLLVIGIWGVAGVVAAVFLFSWEPRR